MILNEPFGEIEDTVSGSTYQGRKKEHAIQTTAKKHVKKKNFLKMHLR